MARNRPSWKRYLKAADDPLTKRLDRQIEQTRSIMAIENSTNTLGYSNRLPQVYTGPQGRIERYTQYDYMDLDLHIHRSLNIISEFCTQSSDSTGLPFEIKYNEKLSESQTELLEKYLRKWCRINKFKNRLYDMVRNICKYGDQIYIRDPETYEWIFVNVSNVSSVVVDEIKGKKPEFYNIANLDLNQMRLTASFSPTTSIGTQPMLNSDTYAKSFHNTLVSTTANNQMGGNNSRFNGNNTTNGITSVDAQHIIHLSLNKGDDLNWPFGTSLLESIFKTYKQKELVEDSVLIYLTQRAPERLIFRVDVGDMHESKAMAYINRLKNELQQRRIPSRNSNDANTPTATYSPMSILENYFFPQTADGRGSNVEQLPGGDTNWGLELLRFFDNRLARGLEIPSSYIPTSDDDSAPSWNDGRLGTILVQELQFAKRCERIQNKLIDIFDLEFKAFLKKSDITISAADFELQFLAPQNYATWREIDIDSAKIGNFNSIINNGSISIRFAMEKYLGLTEADIHKNTKMWMEENPSKLNDSGADKFLNQEAGAEVAGLEDIGLSGGDFNDEFDDDFDDEMGDMDIDNTDMEALSAAGETGEVPDISDDEV